jgi:hypothetical protein
MAWDYDNTRFKIGDLVRVIEDVDFELKGIAVQQGEVGLILEVEDSFDSLASFWGIDYVVLLRGELQLLFFDFELEFVDEEKNKKPTKENKQLDKLKFTFLRY